MCFMDWRIGRLIRSVTSAKVSNASGVVVLPPAPQRVGVTLWGTSNGMGVIIMPDGFLGLGGTPATTGNVTPVHITLSTHGDLPTKQLTFVSLQEGPDTIFVTEYFAPEDVLRLGLEQIRNQYPL